MGFLSFYKGKYFLISLVLFTKMMYNNRKAAFWRILYESHSRITYRRFGEQCMILKVYKKVNQNELFKN